MNIAIGSIHNTRRISIIIPTTLVCTLVVSFPQGGKRSGIHQAISGGCF